MKQGLLTDANIIFRGRAIYSHAAVGRFIGAPGKLGRGGEGPAAAPPPGSRLFIWSMIQNLNIFIIPGRFFWFAEICCIHFAATERFYWRSFFWDGGKATAPVMRPNREWRHKNVLRHYASPFLLPYRTFPLFPDFFFLWSSIFMLLPTCFIFGDVVSFTIVKT